MNHFTEQRTQQLFDRKLITENQFTQVKVYRKLGIFSLHAELKLFLYLSVVSFTTGIGILIYQNIDSIGHLAILAVLLVVTAVCYYISFKNSNRFSSAQTSFENPIYDYIILAAVLLSCIFTGYLQFQYTAFGTHYDLATLIPTAMGLFVHTTLITKVFYQLQLPDLPLMWVYHYRHNRYCKTNFMIQIP